MNLKRYQPRLIFALLLIIGLVLRLNRLEQLAGFDFDQETAAWRVKSLLVDHKLSLVGQEISLGGVFIGPLFYYLLALFYSLSRLDPLAANLMVTVLSLLTMSLVYVLGKKMFNQKVGLLALFLYSFSFQINFYDRTTAPSNLIMLFSLALFYGLSQIIDLNKKIIYLGIILGLALSIHPTIFLVLPVIGLYLWRSEVSLKSLVISLSAFLLFLAPLVIFELRHDFVGFAAGLQKALSPGLIEQSYPPIFKILINLRVLGQSLEQIVFPQNALWQVTLTLTIVTGLVITGKWQIGPWKWFLLWSLSPVLLLSFYRQNVPEYYFLVVFPIFLIFLAAYWEEILFSKFWIPTAFFLLSFVVVNLQALFSYSNPVSLRYKKMAVSYIASQSSSKQVSLAKAIDLGQDNGFSYLFFLKGITLSSEAKNRYIIAIPAKNSSAAGEIFGDIKVIKQ